MSRSTSSAYGTPEASHSRGNIENGVKPGIVLISLITRPSAVSKKSTRASPSQPSDSKAWIAYARMRSLSVWSISAGTVLRLVPSRYLASKS